MKSERGSLTTEIVLLVPCLIAIVLLVVYAGTVTRTSFQIQQAATAAARAASMVSRTHSQDEAARTATQLLREHKAPCSRAKIAAELIRIHEVSAIRVTVSCAVSPPDVAGSGVTSVNIVKSSVSVIDRYRHQ